MLYTARNEEPESEGGLTLNANPWWRAEIFPPQTGLTPFHAREKRKGWPDEIRYLAVVGGCGFVVAPCNSLVATERLNFVV
uniref:Uncharacterized protein n=1 Tax=Vespula pensylvanica TaxID=30213 RepID=A0A834UEV7_VESPE|nr:hypothetical protein H0235_002971 [Vespula pensylvanica]